jgi:hypothetical protein
MDDKYNEHKFTFTRIKPIKTEHREFKIVKDGVEIENPEEFLRENNINIDEILRKNGGTPFTEVKDSFRFEYSNNPNPFSKEVPKQTLYNGRPTDKSVEKTSKINSIIIFLLGFCFGIFILLLLAGVFGYDWVANVSRAIVEL